MKIRFLGIAVLVIVMFSAAGCGGSNSSGGTSFTPVHNEYAVFAWNDLGMHCLNATYDQLVILPPYNNLWVQVVQRGAPPVVVTAGITVEFTIINNTSSDGKRSYGQFWTYAFDLFGITPASDEGLTGTGLSGVLVLDGDHFIAQGIPLVPVDDSDVWNPYQVAEVTVKDAGTGDVLAVTRVCLPVSDEINCAACHTGNTFADVLSDHDTRHATTLSASTPVLCADCHGSPALGTSGPGTSGKYLSQAIHGAHASRGAACYDCHPGDTTQCSRSLEHTAADGNCAACHVSMTEVASSIASGRIPWAEEPACIDCHTGVAGIDTGAALYRNATGHGNLYCAACHGSPHAQIPSREAADNYQALQYQGWGGRAKSLGSCGVCHGSSRGGGSSEFAEQHGGLNPDSVSACNTCHTATLADVPNWPHAYQWNNSN